VELLRTKPREEVAGKILQQESKEKRNPRENLKKKLCDDLKGKFVSLYTETGGWDCLYQNWSMALNPSVGSKKNQRLRFILGQHVLGVKKGRFS